MATTTSTSVCLARNLALIAYAAGFSMFQYKSTEHKTAEISAEGYFDAAKDFLASGDMIVIQGSDGSSQVIVSKTEAGRIVVAPLAAAGGSTITPAEAIADLSLTDQGAAYDQATLNTSLAGIKDKLNAVIAALRSTGIINV